MKYCKSGDKETVDRYMIKTIMDDISVYIVRSDRLDL